MLAIDISRYLGRAPMVGELERLRNNHGVGMLIVGLWDGATGPDWAAEAFGNARATGLQIAGYIALWPGMTGPQHVDSGRAVAGDDWARLAFCAVDMEGRGVLPADGREAVNRVEALGIRSCVYTGYGTWTDNGGDDSLADVPLWDANYNRQTDLVLQREYGGWTQASVIGHQYLGNVTLEGVKCDVSVFDDAWLNAGEGDVMTPEQIAEIKRVAAIAYAWGDLSERMAAAAVPIANPLDAQRAQELHDIATSLNGLLPPD